LPALNDDLNPHLMDRAALQFSVGDILTFLGRRRHPCFDGKVWTKLHDVRL